MNKPNLVQRGKSTVKKELPRGSHPKQRVGLFFMTARIRNTGIRPDGEMGKYVSYMIERYGMSTKRFIWQSNFVLP